MARRNRKPRHGKRQRKRASKGIGGADTSSIRSVVLAQDPRHHSDHEFDESKKLFPVGSDNVSYDGESDTLEIIIRGIKIVTVIDISKRKPSIVSHVGKRRGATFLARDNTVTSSVPDNVDVEPTLSLDKIEESVNEDNGGEFVD